MAAGERMASRENVQNIFSSFFSYCKLIDVWTNKQKNCVPHLGRLSLRLTPTRLQQAPSLPTWSTWQQCRWTPCWRQVSTVCVSGFKCFKSYRFFCAQVWSATKGNEVAAWLSPGPLNCVSFHPEEHLLAAGCWNGNVIMWNWLQNKSDGVSSHQQTSNNWFTV